MLHKLSWSLVNPLSEERGERMSDCPFQCYLALRGLREDGNFITPEVLTGILSKFKYFFYNCSYLQADRIRETIAGGIIA
jgi:hypothetical protein